MQSKKYRRTRKTLGDVFGDKVIITDTRDLVAYILKEEKDPNTGLRRYRKVVHGYFDRADYNITHQKIEYPPFPITADDMNNFHPPGRYIIKVVNRHNKAKSYGSVVFVNEESCSFTDEELLSSQSPKSNSAIQCSNDKQSSEIKERLDRLEEKILAWLNSWNKT